MYIEAVRKHQGAQGSWRKRMGSGAVAITAIGALVLLAGCSSSNATPKTDGELSHSGPVSVTWWGADARNQAMTETANAFAKEAGVEVQTQPTSYDTYWDRLTVQSAGHTLPCVIATNTRKNGEFEAKGAFIPLDGLIKSGAIDVSDISPESLKGQQNIDGKLYTIPHGFWFEGVLYNETEIERLGIPLPQEGWTWEKYIDWAHTAQRSLPSGSYAINDRSGEVVQFQAYAMAHGEDLFAKDKKKVGFSADTLANWFTLWQGARNDGVIPPAEVAAQDQQTPNVSALLAKKRVLISTQSDNLLGEFQTGLDAIKGGTLKMLGLPTGDKPQVIGSNSWSISSDCKNEKDAAAFINYYVNTPEVTTMMKGQSGLAVNNTVLAAQENDSSTDAATKARITLLQALTKAGAHTDVWPSNSQTLETLITSTAEEIAFGKTPIKDGVASLISQVNDSLSGNL